MRMIFSWIALLAFAMGFLSSTSRASDGVSPRRALTEVIGALQMQMGAGIAGRVVDSEGNPLADITVMAFQRATTLDGALVAVPGGGEKAVTDDRGRFRVFGLLPGDYCVLARPSNPRHPPGASKPNTEILAPTFFPGTRDLTAAQLISVAADQEIGGFEIKMVSTAGLSVSGSVTNTKLAPVPRAALTLVSWPTTSPMSALRGIITSPDLSYEQWVASTEAGPDGHFSINEVPSGTYTLIASTPVKEPQEAPPQTSMRVTVAKDVTGLEVVVQE